jgi:hypothetical protein
MNPRKKAPPVEHSEQTTVRIRVLPDGRMTAKDAALYLGSEPQTLAEWRWKDQGPDWVKIHGRIWYYQKALDAYIAEGRRQPRRRRPGPEPLIFPEQAESRAPRRGSRSRSSRTSDPSGSPSAGA